MARIRGPLFSFGASGTFANRVTHLALPSGPIARRKNIPTQANSAAQLAQRAYFSQAIAAWHAATPAQRATHQAAADANNLPLYNQFISDWEPPRTIGRFISDGTPIWYQPNQNSPMPHPWPLRTNDPIPGTLDLDNYCINPDPAIAAGFTQWRMSASISWSQNSNGLRIARVGFRPNISIMESTIPATGGNQRTIQTMQTPWMNIAGSAGLTFQTYLIHNAPVMVSVGDDIPNTWLEVEFKL